MGFISSMLDKSVFNKGSYAAAIGAGDKNGYAVVKISPNTKRLSSNPNDTSVDVPIVGVIADENGLEYSIESNWTELGGIAQSVLPNSISKYSDAYKQVNNVANIAGAANMGAAYASKKIYQQSGFLTLKLQLMVVDWQGQGTPVLSSQLLSYYMLPRKIGDLGDVVDAALEKMKETVKTLQAKGKFISAAEATMLEGTIKAIEGIGSIPGAIDGYLEKNLDGLALSVYNTAKENALKNKEDLYTLRSSPVPVSVEIGQFFKNTDMVITNCKFEFSKEMTRMGPLYVKMDLDLTSRMILTSMDDIGLISLNKEARYKEATNFY